MMYFSNEEAYERFKNMFVSEATPPKCSRHLLSGSIYTPPPMEREERERKRGGEEREKKKERGKREREREGKKINK